MNEKYNKDFWINHFVDFYIRMNFVYIYSRKNDAFSVIREFWERFESNTIKSFDL
jgi:hypothetical protein